MKKLLVLPILLATLLVSCNKDDNGNDQKKEDKVPGTLKEYFEGKTEKLTETFSVDNTKEQTITLESGTTVRFKPGTFLVDGQPVAGKVNVSVLEVRPDKLSSSIFSRTNTNLIDGKILETYGYMNITATTQAGKEVDKNLGHNMRIAVATEAEDNTEALLWTVDEDEIGNGGPNDPAGEGGANQFEWNWFREEGMIWDDEGEKPIQEWNRVVANAGSFTFDFGKLGWVNVDVIWNPNNENTTIKVTLGGMIGEWANYMGWGGNTYVFFIAEGSPVVVQIYTQVQGESNSVQSYYNQMPVGVKGQWLAFSVVDGKYYMATTESTTTADQIIAMDLEETTMAILDQTIKGIDGYGTPEE